MFIKLLEMSFTSGVLLLIVIFIRACLFKKLPKKVFVLLWLIVLFKLLIPVSLNSGFSIYSIIESTFEKIILLRKLVTLQVKTILTNLK